jgi:hypothetical protein
MVRQMTNDERWRAIGMLDAGCSIRTFVEVMARFYTAI